MFDIGFQEMAVIALVALVVLGPDRLPRVAKQAGQWLGKLQRYVADVKSDINRQMDLDELRKMQSEVKDAASTLETSLRDVASGAKSEFDSLSQSVTETGKAEPPTDWDKIYAVRRARDRIMERRTDRAKTLGHKVPKRRR